MAAYKVNLTLPGIRKTPFGLYVCGGVQSVGLGSEGIEVQIADPSLVPDSLEGLPVHVLPPSGPYIGATEE